MVVTAVQFTRKLYLRNETSILPMKFPSKQWVWMQVIKSTNDKITKFLVPLPYLISISSGIVIKRRLSFWTCKQLLFLVFIYFCFKCSLCDRSARRQSQFFFRFCFSQSDFPWNWNWIFPWAIFIVWILSTKPFDLQIHWKCLCQTDLSSLITWKVFSVKFSEIPQLLHVNVRLDIFLL